MRAVPVIPAGISWTGGPARWHASGYMLMFGPMIERVCVTKLGARFAAWRRRRAHARALPLETQTTNGPT